MTSCIYDYIHKACSGLLGFITEGLEMQSSAKYDDALDARGIAYQRCELCR